MNWKKALGYGALIWIIMFAVASVFAGYKLTGFWTEVVMWVVLAVAAFFFARSLSVSSAGKLLGYGLVWVVLGVVLDLLISARFVSGLFAMWSYWVGYALVLLMPMLAVKKQQSQAVQGI